MVGAVPRAGCLAAGSAPAQANPTIRPLDADALSRLQVADRVVSPFSSDDVGALLASAAADGGRVVGAVSGATIVGLAVAAPSGEATESLLAVGVAPGLRGAGLGGALLRELVAGRSTRASMEARVGVAERDVVDPQPVETRSAAARRLLLGAGFELRRPTPDDIRDDPWALRAELLPP